MRITDFDSASNLEVCSGFEITLARLSVHGLCVHSVLQDRGSSSVRVLIEDLQADVVEGVTGKVVAGIVLISGGTAIGSRLIYCPDEQELLQGKIQSIVLE